MNAPMNAIETIGLTKYYGKSRGVVDLNFTLREGEIYGFIGPNGAGKSTTIRLLLSLLYPTRGSGSVFGMNIATEGPAIKQIVGFVPSEVHYYSKMTVRELLHYSARFYQISLDREHKQMIEALLNLWDFYISATGEYIKGWINLTLLNQLNQ